MSKIKTICQFSPKKISNNTCITVYQNVLIWCLRRRNNKSKKLWSLISFTQIRYSLMRIMAIFLYAMQSSQVTFVSSKRTLNATKVRSTITSETERSMPKQPVISYINVNTKRSKTKWPAETMAAWSPFSTSMTCTLKTQKCSSTSTQSCYSKRMQRPEVSIPSSHHLQTWLLFSDACLIIWRRCSSSRRDALSLWARGIIGSCVIWIKLGRRSWKEREGRRCFFIRFRSRRPTSAGIRRDFNLLPLRWRQWCTIQIRN